MKITQKRTCFGCKALNYKYIHGVKEGYCQLGYETGAMVNVPHEYLPVEPCPKPMTQKDWETAMTTFRKNDSLIATQDIKSRKALFEEISRDHILVKLDGYTEYTQGYYIAIPEAKWKAIEKSLEKA